MTDCLAVGQNGGDARNGQTKGKTMKQKAVKTAAARKNQKLAEGLRAVMGISDENQEALYGLASMLGGLELLRFAADATRGWGNETQGLEDELAPHLDGIEAVLKKYRDGSMHGWPEAATA